MAPNPRLRTCKACATRTKFLITSSSSSSNSSIVSSVSVPVTRNCASKKNKKNKKFKKTINNDEYSDLETVTLDAASAISATDSNDIDISECLTDNHDGDHMCKIITRPRK